MPKQSSCISFWSSWPKECNGAIDNTILATHVANLSRVTWPKKSCCISFQLSWLKKCNGSIDDAISILLCQSQCQWYHMTKKVKLHPISVVLAKWMQWCHWNHYRYDTNVVINYVTWPKGPVVPPFDHLDLSNAMVPLTMLSTSHDADIMQWHHMVLVPMPLASCHVNADSNCII